MLYTRIVFSQKELETLANLLFVIGQISHCMRVTNALAVFEYAEFRSFQSFYYSLVILPNYVQKYNENHYRARNV